jgi:hypothetical protein
MSTLIKFRLETGSMVVYDVQPQHSERTRNMASCLPRNSATFGTGRFSVKPASRMTAIHRWSGNWTSCASITIMLVAKHVASRSRCTTMKKRSTRGSGFTHPYQFESLDAADRNMRMCYPDLTAEEVHIHESSQGAANETASGCNQ